jgi:dTDP-D-glucose 4,6-dehydratase
LADDFQPRHVMITGGAGFIASHVCILLARKYPHLKIVNFNRLFRYPFYY